MATRTTRTAAKTTAAKATAAKAPARKAAAAPARKLPAKKAAAAPAAPAPAAQAAQSRRRLRPAVPLTHSEQEPDSTVHEGEVLPPVRGPRATSARTKAAPAQPPSDGEQDPADAGQEKTEQAATATVTFHGRPMLVRVPEPEQIVIYQRVAAQFQERTAKGPIGGQEAVKLYDRALKVITSLIIDPDDVTYIEDLLLERKTNLAGCTPILTDAVSALRDANPHLEGNRETRRQAAKVSRKA